MQLNGHANQFFYDSLKKKDQKIGQLQSAMGGLEKSEAVR